jgi:phytoene synthase
VAGLGESAAIRHCQTITRQQAKNFWYGIRLLPPDKRRALAVVYAMARRIDDIGDGDLAPDQKRIALDLLEASLRALNAHSDDHLLAGLDEVCRVYPLPLDAFHYLIEGVRMDIAGTSYECFEDLIPYCRRVAGSVGRLSLAVFGAADGKPWDGLQALADDLGVALQLTNILRDVREDFANGRVYLPAEDLRRFGAHPADLGGSASPQIAALIAFEAARAEAWFVRGLQLLPKLDRRSAACVGSMAGIYLRLLRRIADDPLAVMRGRLSLPAPEKAWVAARAIAGLAP